MKSLELITVLIALVLALAFIPYSLAQEQLIYVFVDSEIYTEIEFYLNRWQADVAESLLPCTQGES